MSTVTLDERRVQGGAGALLRSWRHRRRLSQLDLASNAEVSARHLSFVETGRSRPSRELLLHLADHLDVPLRERNALLLAAGYAPLHQQTPLDAPAMGSVRDALATLLSSHEPAPALIVDRHWDIVDANRPLLALLDGVAPSLLEAPVNAVRVSLHPDGLAPRIVNLAEWRAHLLHRLERQVALTGDETVAALLAESRAYPSVAGGDARAPDPSQLPNLLFVPLRLRVGDDTLSFFSTVTTFGTAVDITLAELSIEQFFAADAVTSAALAEFAAS